ncbi:kinase-like domain-containing protein [Rhizophagus irregularis DAOM 181602=DAOM 197198]|nr:kinase-like domain-containing protein [Rhizophagus irregularis DAOM 181602=DAOM 197198]
MRLKNIQERSLIEQFDGPLCKMNMLSGYYARDPNINVALKYLHNSQDSVDFLINEAKKYSTKIFDRLHYIKEADKNDLITLYSAIWKAGPLYKRYGLSNYTRNPCKEVALKCLHNSQESIDSLINKAKKYLTIHNAFQVLHSNNKIALKCFHNSQKSIDSLINEANKYQTKHKAFQVLYGISQNPFTGDYILILNLMIFIDSLINKAKKYPTKYKAFQVLDSNIKVVLKCSHNLQVSIDSLIYEAKKYSIKHEAFQKNRQSNYTRNSNKEVALKYLHNSQIFIDSLINKAKKYPIKHKAFQVLNLNIEVVLKCLHNSQESIDSLINEAKKYPTKHKAFQALNAIKNK